MTDPIKPAGRTLAEFEPLKTAEQALLEACRKGVFAQISKSLPEEANEQNTVRATFIRFLALGGDEKIPVHEHGVLLYGAWVTGELAIEATKVPVNINIRKCHFDSAPAFRDAKLAGSLCLDGCWLPGLKGDRLACAGGVFLRGCIASGEVRLLGAWIGGNLDCSKATFDGKGGDALSADGAAIKGGVFLTDGFTASGTVRLLNAQIGGNLDCVEATFDGKGGDALSADGMKVEGALFFRDLQATVNRISLAGSHVGHLLDDAKSWGENILLDGFTYGGIAGGAPTDAQTRLAWLDKQREADAGLDGEGAGFRPQPWRQLAKVLREMGHAEDARQVAIAFEHRLRKANLIGRLPGSDKRHWVFKVLPWFFCQITRVGHWLFWLFTGYGYRPLRLLGWMVFVWLLSGAIYWQAALDGVFAPSNPLVFQNPDYQVCAPSYVTSGPRKSSSSVRYGVKGAGNWYLCEDLPAEYSTFSPLAYSLDVILPLVDLQQETSWAPLIPTPDETWRKELFSIFDEKHFTRLVLWFEILFGWVSSLLLVAIVSGLAKRREE